MSGDHRGPSGFRSKSDDLFGVSVEKGAAEFCRDKIRAEMLRLEVSYEMLAGALNIIGVEETARNLSNKINRGTFSAIFMFQCLAAMGIRNISNDYLLSIDNGRGKSDKTQQLRQYWRNILESD